MALTKVLITVKTYPTLSTKYNELVCTAGFREDGTWIRIYPIQFRKRPYAQQYKKYQWIELDIVKNEKDFRPESFRPVSHDTKINLLKELPPDGEAWHDRRKIVLGKIYYNLAELIAEAKNKSIQTSLAVFRPSIVKDFVVEGVEREWSKEKGSFDVSGLILPIHGQSVFRKWAKDISLHRKTSNLRRNQRCLILALSVR